MKRIFLLLLVLVFAGCAKIVSPTGGAKDIAPPVVLGTEPKSGQTNFDEKELKFNFDEYIQLVNPNEEVFISPILAKKPLFKKKGKSLIIEFQEELPADKTITIDFGESIKDVNEGNVLPNLTYVFSTGEKLDSLEISGKILLAENNRPAKEGFVALYEVGKHDSIKGVLPDYITKIRQAGNFTLKSLKKGEYDIIAFEDKNGNFTYDQIIEGVAFLDSSIVVTDTAKLKSLGLKMFHEKQKIKLLSKKNEEYGKLEMIFSEGLKEAAISDWKGIHPDSIKMIWSTEKDSLQIWYKDKEPPSASFVLTSKTFLDTISFGFLKKKDKERIFRKRGAKGKGKKEKKSIPVNKTFQWIFNHPIEIVDTSKMILMDSLENKLKIQASIDSIRNNLLKIDWEKEKDKKYNLVLLPASVTDFFGKTTDSLKAEIRVVPKKEKGDLIVTLKNKGEHTYLLKVLSEKEKLITEKEITDTLVKINQLDAGKYRLLVLKDDNQNNKWDTGNFAKRKQAEKIFSAKNLITIEEKFETEIEIDLTE